MRALMEDKLQKYINIGQYEKAVTILRKILIECFVIKIQEKKKDYVYTDMIDLIRTSESYLDEEMEHLPMYIDNFSEELIDYSDELDRMLEIYSRLKNS